MIKSILAAAIVLATFTGGAEAAMMKKMDHMAMTHKCGKGMMMHKGKCMADKMHMMHMMKK